MIPAHIAVHLTKNYTIYLEEYMRQADELYRSGRMGIVAFSVYKLTREYYRDEFGYHYFKGNEVKNDTHMAIKLIRNAGEFREYKDKVNSMRNGHATGVRLSSIFPLRRGQEDRYVNITHKAKRMIQSLYVPKVGFTSVDNANEYMDMEFRNTVQFLDKMSILKRIPSTLGGRAYYNYDNAKAEDRFFAKMEQFQDKYGVEATTCKTLLHGSDRESIKGIIDNGFSLSKAQSSGAFGPGIYFGELSKARNYSKTDNEAGAQCFIRADILLGRTYNAQQVGLPPNFRATYDSVYANIFRRPEWVVYDLGQILIRGVLVV